MTTESKSTMTEEESTPFTCRINSLKSACHSGDEQKVRIILSENDWIDCLKSSAGYELLCSTLLSFLNDFAEKSSMTIERDSLQLFVVCEILLQHGAEVNDTLSQEFRLVTPLHIAVRIGNENIVKLLLSTGAAVNMIRNGVSPLDNAVIYGFKHIAEILLENGADPDNCDKDDTSKQYSPLHLAIIHKNEEIVHLLLSKGAAINRRSRAGYSPLHFTVVQDSKHMVQLLLENGADPDNCDNNDGSKQYSSPLQHAITRENEEIVQLLLSKGAAINIINQDGLSPLHFAIFKNSKHMVQLLLENGADPDNYDESHEKNFPPLHYAVQVGNEEIIKLLLLKGADVTIQRNRFTPLYTAVSNNLTQIAQILLQNGADPGNCNDFNKSNITALHIAVVCEYKEMVELLFANGAAADSKNHASDRSFQCDFFQILDNISQLFLENPANPDNLYNAVSQDLSLEITTTPLLIAVLKGNKEIVEIVLSKGVDVNAKNNCWDTALHCAVSRDFKDISQLLLDNGADLDIRNKRDRKPFDSSKNLSMKNLYSRYRIKMYLDSGAHIEDTDDDGYTLLHHAVSFNSKDAILFLLARGCNVNAVTKSGESPLHLAVKKRQEEITLLLLQNGGDVNAATNTGCTPLHLSVANNYSYENDSTLLAILIQNGANIKHKNNFGLTALNYAVKWQAPCKAQVLLGENLDNSDKELKMAFCLSFLNHKVSYNCGNRDGSQCLCELFFNSGFTIHVEDFDDMHIPEELYSTWLTKSADENFRSIVQNFLNKPENSNTIDMNRRIMEFQVIVGAVKHGFMEIFFNLSTPEMNVNTRLQDGNTLLHYACLHGKLEIAQELLRRGANVNALNDNKESPLHFSISGSSVKLATLLLKKGADVDACNASNETPLYVAVDELDISAVSLLLAYGANVNCVRNERSPLHIALNYHEEGIVTLLLHYGAFVNPSDSFKIIPTYLAWDHDDDDDDYDESNLRLINLVFNYGAKVVGLSPNLFDNPAECAKLKIKCIAANLENFDFSINSDELADFQTKCLEEIARMKSTEIGGCIISMYDLLVKSPRQTAMYMRNISVVEMLNSINYKKLFPIYADKLRVCVRKGKLENRLIELSCHCLEVILKVKLPDVIVVEVISYLNTSDLHRLIIASPIDKKKKSCVKYSQFIKSFKM